MIGYSARSRTATPKPENPNMKIWELSLAAFVMASLAGLSTHLFLGRKLSRGQWVGLAIMSGMLGVTWLLWGYQSALESQTLIRHFASSIIAGFGSSVIVSYGLRILINRFNKKLSQVVDVLSDDSEK